MDWYYPILGGVLRGHSAEARVAAGWQQFVVEGRGVRCVSDRPWVTAAETCELVMALDAIGLDRARELFTWVQFLRHEDGGYWTGMNFDDERFDDRRRAVPRRAADVELRRRRARGQRARRHGRDGGPVPRRGTARRPHSRRAHRGRGRDRSRAHGPAARAALNGQHSRSAQPARSTRSEPVVEIGSNPSLTARFHTS